MWTVFTIIAAISLAIYWRGPNSVWGGITFGGIGGLIVAIISAFLGRGFHLSTIGKGIVIGILFGVLAELLGKVSNRVDKTKEQ